MAESIESQAEDQSVELKDPWLAGFLGWLIPGLGHFYQGRNAKGALFAICIMGTFLYGLYLGGSKEDGWGRAVYFSFRPNDWRLPWLCQIGVGLPTVPMTLWQWNLGDKPWFNGFMAPPPLPDPANTLRNGPPGPRPSPDQENLAWINRSLRRYFDLGTVYTMIAGLLNILAVYDACCGPVPAESAKNEDEKPEGSKPEDSADPEVEEKK